MIYAVDGRGFAKHVCRYPVRLPEGFPKSRGNRAEDRFWKNARFDFAGQVICMLDIAVMVHVIDGTWTFWCAHGGWLKTTKGLYASCEKDSFHRPLAAELVTVEETELTKPFWAEIRDTALDRMPDMRTNFELIFGAREEYEGDICFDDAAKSMDELNRRTESKSGCLQIIVTDHPHKWAEACDSLRDAHFFDIASVFSSFDAAAKWKEVIHRQIRQNRFDRVQTALNRVESRRHEIVRERCKKPVLTLEPVVEHNTRTKAASKLVWFAEETSPTSTVIREAQKKISIERQHEFEKTRKTAVELNEMRIQKMMAKLQVAHDINYEE